MLKTWFIDNNIVASTRVQVRFDPNERHDGDPVIHLVTEGHAGLSKADADAPTDRVPPFTSEIPIHLERQLVRVHPTDNIPRSQEESVEPQASAQVPLDLSAVDVSTMTVREGRLKLVEHFRRERNREIIQAKKQQVLRTTGCLTCEVCSFDFERIYGRLGRGFCEVHHKVPLAEVGTEVITKLEDLAILCANCHRMVHRTNPFKSIEELKRLVTSRT